MPSKRLWIIIIALLIANIILGFYLWKNAWAGVTFDGVDDSARTVDINITTMMSTGAGTMMGWMFPTGAGTSGGSVNCYEGEQWFKPEPPNDYASIGIARNSNLGGLDRICAWNYDGAEIRVPTAYTVSAWTHLAWVNNGTNLYLYKDGVLVNSTAIGTVFIDGYEMKIGLGKDAAGATGTMAGIRVYSSALSANEIEMLGKSRLQRIGSIQPTGSWPLDQCAQGASADAVAFTDQSGNGRPLTGSDGANNTGLTCQPNTVLSFPWGPY